jgi:hypothetical protein
MAKNENSSVRSNSKYLYISQSRFIMMSLITFGLYEAYWIYKNWQYIEKRDKINIKPFWRGIFGIFYIHTLLQTMHDDSELNKINKAEFSASNLATGWILLVIIGNILGRFDNPAILMLSILISAPSFVFLLPVQNYINKINESIHPQVDYYNWSLGHLVCLIIGSIYWLIFLFGFASKA